MKYPEDEAHGSLSWALESSFEVLASCEEAHPLIFFESTGGLMGRVLDVLNELGGVHGPSTCFLAACGMDKMGDVTM